MPLRLTINTGNSDQVNTTMSNSSPNNQTINESSTPISPRAVPQNLFINSVPRDFLPLQRGDPPATSWSQEVNLQASDQTQQLTPQPPEILLGRRSSLRSRTSQEGESSSQPRRRRSVTFANPENADSSVPTISRNSGQPPQTPETANSQNPNASIRRGALSSTESYESEIEDLRIRTLEEFREIGRRYPDRQRSTAPTSTSNLSGRSSSEETSSEVQANDYGSSVLTTQSSTGATAGTAEETTATQEGSSTIGEGEVLERQSDREQLMRQMVAEIERYDRLREREFEREYGYSRWSPESTPERRGNRSRSPSLDLTSEGDDGIPELVEDSTRTRGPDPRLGTNTPGEEIMSREGRNSGSQYMPASNTNMQAADNQQRVALYQPEGELQRPAFDRNDPSEDFLKFVIRSNPPIVGPMHLRFEETSLSDNERGTRYGFWRQGGYRVEPDEEFRRLRPVPTALDHEDEFYVERSRLRRLPQCTDAGIDVVSHLLTAAMREGLDCRNSFALLHKWAQYVSTWTPARGSYPNLPFMVPPPALGFWVTLRRGWGNWIPDDLDVFKNILQCYTNFEYFHPDSRLNMFDITEHELLSRLRLSTLPPEERRIFSVMINAGMPTIRVAALFRSWAMFAPSIGDTSRLPSEQHFSVFQLRMDRLSRLLREEQVITSQEIDSEFVISLFVPEGSLQTQIDMQIKWFHRPANESFDPAEEYLNDLLLKLDLKLGGSNTVIQSGRRFNEGNRQRIINRCSLAGRAGFSDSNTEYGDILAEFASGFPASEATVLENIIQAAADDGMELNERIGLLLEWKDMSQSFKNHLLDHPTVSGLLPLSIMIIWMVVRRGWGNWRPSSRMLRAMRELLSQNTDINHNVQRGSVVSEAALLANIHASILPAEEKEIFERAIGSRTIPYARINRIFENWAHYEIIIDDTRLESEEHFSREELRLDRLIRIVREERLINARRIVRVRYAGLDHGIDGIGFGRIIQENDDSEESDGEE